LEEAMHRDAKMFQQMGKRQFLIGIDLSWRLLGRKDVSSLRLFIENANQLYAGAEVLRGAKRGQDPFA
jgi:hypothetical protein